MIHRLTQINRCIHIGYTHLSGPLGEHGRLSKPKGGRLWTVHEEEVIKNSCQAKPLTTARVCDALKTAGLPVRCTTQQLHDYVSREKKNQQGQSSSKADLTIGELKARVDAFPPMDTQWRALPCHQLIVVQGAIVEAERVCIVFTCPGMLDRARAAESKFIKLVVDGKQKIVTNDYTMSFLVPSEAAVQTRGAAKRSSRVKAYTCTQEPFTQAFVSSESLKLETARNISAEHCGLDMEHQVLQVHKDYAYAPGAEAARKKVFRSSRRCDDYPHMGRAAHTIWSGASCAGLVTYNLVIPTYAVLVISKVRKVITILISSVTRKQFSKIASFCTYTFFSLKKDIFLLQICCFCVFKAFFCALFFLVQADDLFALAPPPSW